MRKVLLMIGVLLLAACAAEGKYDIDVSCDRKTDFVEYDHGDPMLEYVCFNDTAPYDVLFSINCEKNTVQKIGSQVFCTTADKQKVRMTVGE